MNFSFPNSIPVDSSTVIKFLSASTFCTLYFPSELWSSSHLIRAGFFCTSLTLWRSTSFLGLLCPSRTRVQCRSFCSTLTTIKRELKIILFIIIVGIKWHIHSVFCVATCQRLLTVIAIVRILGFLSSAIFNILVLRPPWPWILKSETVLPVTPEVLVQLSLGRE